MDTLGARPNSGENGDEILPLPSFDSLAAVCLGLYDCLCSEMMIYLVSIWLLVSVSVCAFGYGGQSRQNRDAAARTKNWITASSSARVPSAPWAPTAGSEARVTRESATNTHTDPTEPSHRSLSLPRCITPRRRPPDSSGSTRVANASLGALSLGGGGVLT